MKITRKLQPFTHRMGAAITLPGTKTAVRIFPARIEVVDGDGVDLPIKGSVDRFTVTQDLEKGGIEVVCGTIRYRILPGTHQPVVLCPKTGKLPWDGEVATSNLPQERLFLGSHKKLDWELVMRRSEPKELFPLWHRLGLMLPEGPPDAGPSLLASACDTPSLTELFIAGFYGLMVPSKTDPYHQGFPLPPLVGKDPYALLAQGARIIRSFFFQEVGKALSLLPALPREFPSGQLLHISTPLGTLSFEWSKHRLRQAELLCQTSGDLSLRLPKEIKRLRVKKGPRERGSVLDSRSPFRVSAGERILLDRFEK